MIRLTRGNPGPDPGTALAFPLRSSLHPCDLHGAGKKPYTWDANSLPCGSQGMHRGGGGFNSCTMHGVGTVTESCERELESSCSSSLGKGASLGSGGLGWGRMMMVQQLAWDVEWEESNPPWPRARPTCVTTPDNPDGRMDEGEKHKYNRAGKCSAATSFAKGAPPRGGAEGAGSPRGDSRLAPSPCDRRFLRKWLQNPAGVAMR